MVEVAGSNPAVSTTIRFLPCFIAVIRYAAERFFIDGGIAQLVRALASHARGRRFESYCLYHFPSYGGFAAYIFTGV